MNDFKSNPESVLWEKLADFNAVMLGAHGDKHMQPMSPQVEPDTKTIWFYTARQTDIAKATGNGADAMICAASEDDGFFACISGRMTVDPDPEAIEKFWSPVVAAWFEKGQQDPDLTMLRFEPSEAEIWHGSGSALKFGWKIAKANVTGEKPDIGDHAVIEIAGGRKAA